MSSVRGTKQGKKEDYATKHDFKKILIGSLETQLILAYKTRIPLAIVGHAGIGKTSIVNQAAEKLSKALNKKVECRTLIASQMVPEDFTGIPIPDMEKRVVEFFKLEQLPRDGQGILFLDELNQADLPVRRPLFQLLGERRIGTYVLPEGWSIATAMNPDGANYGTNKLSPAMRRRMSWVEVKFDNAAFINHAKENNYNEVLVEYLIRNPEKCLNETALLNDKVFSCPASWEKVGQILDAMGPGDTISDIVPICSGLVGFTYFKDFVRFYTDFSQDLDPKELLENYDGSRERILKLTSKGRTDVLTHLSDALVYLMLKIDVSDSTFNLKASNFTKFYIDLPDDTAVYFSTRVNEVFLEHGKDYEKGLWISALSENEKSCEKLLRMLGTTTQIAKEKLRN